MRLAAHLSFALPLPPTHCSRIAKLYSSAERLPEVAKMLQSFL